MINEYIYKVYCNIHRLAKKILQKKRKPLYRMISLNPISFSNNDEIKINGSYINDIEIDTPTNISKKIFFR